ncbi:MAG: MltR family transcriptional regulator [Halanaerobiales bacterium]
MGKCKDVDVTRKSYTLIYDLVEKILESIGIDQLAMYKEALTNIFKNNKLAPLAELISSDILMFHAILLKESDRGSVLMAASYLEDLLEKLLQKFFVNENSLTNTLFNGYGVLSSFSSKIDLSYLLGLISNNAQKKLHLIRKIRNEFAHSSDFIGFSEASISNRCYELKGVNWPCDLSSRDIFIRVVFVLAGIIYSATIQEEGRKEKSSEELDLEKLIPNFEEQLSYEVESYIKKAL